ncbi:MAG TPA: amino acid adenylation domain-containing protein, partial [Thermoanaerobaculia bacterium]|nr:amino acid adenylation domain-containing protein [Thermoanaerobaculia bacterium]
MARRQPRRQPRQPDRRRTKAGAAAARAPGERSRLVVARLRREAARILDVEPAALPLDRSLLSLGLDSLSAAELAAAIAVGMGVELPLDSLLQGPSLEELGERILLLLAVPAAAADGALAAVADGALAAAAAGPVAGGGGAGRFPLSWGQRALWLLDRMVPGGNPAYVIGGAARIRGELDATRLRQALGALAERHPALRSTVVEVGDAAFQVVHDEPRLAFTSEEAGGWSEARLRQRLGEAAQRPFDLARGPLLRVALFRRTATDHLVALAVHHVVADFWSLGILVEELGALYGGRRLPPLAGSYASFVRGQAARMAGAAGRRLAAFWQDSLPPGNPALELPTDRPRPPLPGFRGGSRALSLAPALTASVHALGRRQAATPFMTLLAAFQVLLHRHSGQQELLVGTPTAGRGSPDLDGVVGYFVNPVVLRGDLRGEPSFAALLDRVRQTAIAAFAHQDYPFPLLVERRGGARDPGRSPVFQVMFVFYREAGHGARGLAGFGLGREGARLDLGGLALESVHLPRRSAELDLTLRMAEIDGTLAAELQFDADLFDAATALRMLAQLRTLLAAAAAQPERSVGELPLLDAGERQQLLEWNDTLVPYATELCLHQLIEEQVRRTPAATAVTAGGERLTYRDLNRRANRLARRLRRLGVGREAVVAVCVERSLAMAVGLLAVLKAGGAYLPLDPGDPPQRLRFMLADSGARVLLTGGGAGRRLARRGKAGPVTLRIDAPPAKRGAAAPRDAGAERNLAASRRSAAPDNLAYVIYTSGSTGRPKATMNTHRGIVNRLLWMQQQYRLTAGDRVLQKTPFTFDVSVWELFWPLLAGARLVMARPGGHRDPAYLAATIAADEITVLHFVPAMLRAFLEGTAAAAGGDGAAAAGGGAPRLPALRRVMASGEALSYELQQQYHAAIAAPLHNLYGPTEAAVDVTHWTCDPDRPRVVPIGRPVANTRIHLLDRGGREVPIGVTAELHIGGVQLARGYLGRADLTAEKFVPDPLAACPGA